MSSMEKKDERPSNRVPAGTFGASDPPPPRRSEPGTRAAPLADGVAQSSEPPARDSDADAAAAERRRYTSTLMGHGTPPGTDGVPPPVAPVLAPPKWRGARAYLEGQEPKPRVSTMSVTAPIANAELAAHTTTPGSRVNTKLGTPPAPVPVPALAPDTAPALRGGASTPANQEVDQAIERMLEGQTSVAMEVETSDPDLDQLEELPMEDVMDEPSERAVPLARLALKTTAARVPAPPAPVEAPTREQPGDHRLDAVPAAEIAATLAAASAPPPPTIDPLPPPASAAEITGAAPPPAPPERPSERAARAATNEAPAYGASDTPSALAELRTRRGVGPEQAGNEAKPAPAPSRGLSAAASGAVGGPRPRDQNFLAGSALLAAMVIFGFGGWFLTAGGFRRSTPPASALAEPSAVPKPEPLVPVVPPALVPPQPATTAPAPTGAPSSSSAPSEVAATATREAHSAHGHAADAHGSARHEGESSSRDGREAEQPPVLRIVPQGTQPASSTPSETPTRSEVLAALEPLRPAVERCVKGQHGIAQLDITVVNTGAVTHAIVAGDFAGTPEGSCIALAARDAKFAPFQKPRFRVIFPFSL